MRTAVVRGSVPANVDGPINMTKNLVEIDETDTASTARQIAVTKRNVKLR